VKVQMDRVPVGDTAATRQFACLLGLVTLIDCNLGWSSSLRGKVLGRLKLPIPVPGYLWFDIKLVGKTVLFGSYQLS